MAETPVQITFIPTGGLDVNQTPSDMTAHLKEVAKGVYQSNDVGGYNWDNRTYPGELAKCPGHRKWNATPASTGGRWQAYFVLDDGTNRTFCGIYAGKFYTFGATGTATNIDATVPVTFQTSGPITMVQCGAYVLISDLTAGIYKWKYGDANLTKFIQTGTEYKFKFLGVFNNSVIGAYSDQTNGNIDIRWTDALTPFASMTFPAANQMFKPDDDIGITGIKNLGALGCIIYGRNSIDLLTYYSGYVPPYMITPLATRFGNTSPWALVSAWNQHYFLDINNGFIMLDMGMNPKPISFSILPLLKTIARSSYGLVVGQFLPFNDEICWSVPLNFASDNNTLLFFNLLTGKWRREYKTATALTCDDYGQYGVSTWTDLMAEISALTSTAALILQDTADGNKYQVVSAGKTLGLVAVVSGTPGTIILADELNGHTYQATSTYGVLSLTDLGINPGITNKFLAVDSVDGNTYLLMCANGQIGLSPAGAWPPSGSWSDYINPAASVNAYFGNTDGLTYIVYDDDFDGEPYPAWRIEPIFYMPDQTRHKRFNEIWFDFAAQGDFSVDVFWRTADTESDCRTATWKNLGAISVASGKSAYKLPFDSTGKFHQFMWGNDAMNAGFRVTRIMVKGYIV